MKTSRLELATSAKKAPTGIAGFDEITGGGLPTGRATLVSGGPGSGKTILGLQFLVHGARHCHEPGIFVAFEEATERIVANADGFGWNLAELRRKKLSFLNAQPIPDLARSGTFDLGGLVAALEAATKATGARRVVLDALDLVLALLPDAAAKRREIYRLNEWLLAHRLTALITAKADDGESTSTTAQESFDVMQFMVDCAVVLNHTVVSGVSQRTLRVKKYRGSGFDENESPFLVGASGLEVAGAPSLSGSRRKVSNERVSSGVPRFDTMLGGGYYRGGSVLITGSPGTAKTTLSGAFAEAACRRGERTLFVSFDSDSHEVIRDLVSVGIRLDSYVKSGRLLIASARGVSGSAETFLMRIRKLAEDHKARCLVIDPISIWSKSRNDSSGHSVAERLTDWAKSRGITMICTSLLTDAPSQAERGLPEQISTLADTWVHLSYLVQAGERNRALSIIKSRGTAHSNQVRELILSDAGVEVADIYTAGGEVLMGTLRWEKEQSERLGGELADVASKLKRVTLNAEEIELAVQVQSLQTKLEAKRTEKLLLASIANRKERDFTRAGKRIRELRGADGSRPRRKRDQ